MKYRRCWFDSNPTHWMVSPKRAATIFICGRGVNGSHGRLWPCRYGFKSRRSPQLRAARRGVLFQPRASRRSGRSSNSKTLVSQTRDPGATPGRSTAAFSRWRIPTHSVRQWITKYGVYRQVRLEFDELCDGVAAVGRAGRHARQSLEPLAGAVYSWSRGMPRTSRSTGNYVVWVRGHSDQPVSKSGGRGAIPREPAMRSLREVFKLAHPGVGQFVGSAVARVA